MPTALIKGIPRMRLAASLGQAATRSMVSFPSLVKLGRWTSKPTDVSVVIGASLGEMIIP
jgi:hypothetical protein